MSQRYFILSLLTVFSSFSNSCSAMRHYRMKSFAKSATYTIGGGAAGIGIGFVAGVGIGMAAAPPRSGPIPLYLGLLGAFWGGIGGAILGAVSSFTPVDVVRKDRKIMGSTFKPNGYKNNHAENKQPQCSS